VSTAKLSKSAKLGGEAFGADIAPVKPEFTSVVMSAVKEHPLKTAAALAGIVALGVALSGSVTKKIYR
jgi:hypothetical protein